MHTTIDNFDPNSSSNARLATIAEPDVGDHGLFSSQALVPIRIVCLTDFAELVQWLVSLGLGSGCSLEVFNGENVFGLFSQQPHVGKVALGGCRQCRNHGLLLHLPGYNTRT